MRRHAKVSSAASSKRQAERLCQIVRGVFALPASSLGAEGSGAPAVCAAILAVLALLAFTPAALAASPPEVSGEAAPVVSIATAKLTGEINPEGAAGEPANTSWRIEWTLAGQDAWHVASSGSIEGGAAEEANPIPVEAIVGFGQELRANTSYEFRFFAENASGPDETTAPYPIFETEPLSAVPNVSLNPAVPGVTRARVSAVIEPNGGNIDALAGPLPMFAEFEYTKASEPGAWQHGGAAVVYGPETQTTGSLEVAVNLGTGGAPRLQPGTEYLFRINLIYAGEEFGAPAKSFTTLTSTGPILTTESVQELAPTHVSLQGVVGPNGEATVYWFEYGLTASYEASVPATKDAVPFADPELAEGEQKAMAVQAVYGLTPGTTYHYRLVAKNGSGESLGADSTFTTPAEAESPACSNEAARSEQHAGSLADCRAYEMVSPVDKNGDYVVPRSDRVQVAAECATSCAATFSSQGSFAGSQGTGGTLSDYMALREPSAGSNGWVTHSITPRQEPTPFPALLQGAAPTYENDFSPDLETGIYRAFSPLTDDPYTELTANMYTRSGLRGSGPVSNRLETACPFCEAEDTEPLPTWNYQNRSLPHLDGRSSDFEHILFEDSQNLTGDGDGLNLYQSDAGQVRLVGLVPPGSETSCGAGGPACELPSPPHALPGSGLPLHVLSDDGRRANFSAPVEENGGFTEATQLYQRDSQGTASTADDTTTLISASESQSPEPAQRVRYQTASADGHRVFFSSLTHLSDDTPGGYGYHLYMWHDDHLNDEVQKLTISATGGEFRLLLSGEETGDLPFDASDEEVAQAIESLPGVASAGGTINVAGGPGDEAGSSPYTITFEGGLAETDEPTMTTAAGTTPLTGGAASATVAPWVKGGGNLTLIDVDRNPEEERFGGRVLGAIGASADGSYLYFLEDKQLVRDEPALDRHAGVFLWHEGEIRFVGSLSFGGGFVLNEDRLIDVESYGPRGRNEKLSTRVSADGKTLLVLANEGAGLTGADHGSCEGNPCPEYYVYHLDSGSLACVSCSPQGEPADAAPEIENQFGAGVAGSHHESHAVTDDGRYVFFTTAQSLVPGDTNGAKDAYEFDGASGEVHLLSSGTSPKDSYFAEASPGGHDVFIFTAQKLVGWDVDTSYDLYDVRVDGGVPEPTPQPAGCTGENCRPAPAASPAAGGTSSAAFTGPGNPRPRRTCPRGRRAVKRHGATRCVKRRSHRHPRKHHRRTNTNRRAGR